MLAFQTAVVFGAGLAVAVVALLVAYRARRQLDRESVDFRAELRRRDELRLGLEESEHRLAHALGAMSQGVIVYDQDGDVVFRNDTAVAFTTARHGDALVEATIADVVRAATAGHHAERSLDLFGPPRRSLVISAMPLDGPSGPLGVMASVDDATERKRLEAVRRDFVANISHELRTPVGALALLAETLLSEDDPEVVQRLAQRMADESFRVGRTIDDLLVLSRIEADDTAEHVPVEVGSIVAEAVDRVRPFASTRGITIEICGQPDRLVVAGDRRQLVSAVFNLLDNAVKYSDGGSSVRVSATSDGDLVELTVSDDGIGIPSGDLERVFERFYRVDRARSRDTGGTGLGLAIVRHVVANHHGEVRVASREGEGSSFTLRLPVGALHSSTKAG